MMCRDVDQTALTNYKKNLVCDLMRDRIPEDWLGEAVKAAAIGYAIESNHKLQT